MDENTRTSIASNIFHAAHSAIEDWDKFPWHKGNGRIYTSQFNSSQAMVIDVFGTIKVSPEKNTFMNRVAQKMGFTSSGSWEILLEWPTPKTLLREPRPTQVDAIAQNDALVILFEGKLSETEGGRCSQPEPIKKGRNKGVVQCNSNYELQTNPVNHQENRCALSGKGIKYWDYISKVFNIDSTQNYKPCPFAGSSYQWMRNIVLAQALSEQNKKQPVFILVYADSPQLHMARYIASEEWQQFLNLLRNNTSVKTISFQQIVALAQEANPGNPIWQELAVWIDKKIKETEEKVTKNAKGQKEQ
jgi:hypothetical protein